MLLAPPHSGSGGNFLTSSSLGVLPNLSSSVYYREYSEMATVRHVDFSDSDRPRSLKMAKQQPLQQPPVRSSPQLMSEVAH